MHKFNFLLIPFIFLAASCNRGNSIPVPDKPEDPFNVQISCVNGVLDGGFITSPSYTCSVSGQHTLFMVETSIDGRKDSKHHFVNDGVYENMPVNIKIPDDCLDYGSHVFTTHVTSRLDNSVVTRIDTLHIKGRPLTSVTYRLQPVNRILDNMGVSKMFPEQDMSIGISVVPSTAPLRCEIRNSDPRVLVTDNDTYILHDGRLEIPCSVTNRDSGSATLDITLFNGDEKYPFRHTFSVGDLAVSCNPVIDTVSTGDNPVLRFENVMAAHGHRYSVKVTEADGRVACEKGSLSFEELASFREELDVYDNISLGEKRVFVLIRDLDINTQDEYTVLYFVDESPKFGYDVSVSDVFARQVPVVSLNLTFGPQEDLYSIIVTEDAGGIVYQRNSISGKSLAAGFLFEANVSDRQTEGVHYLTVKMSNDNTGRSVTQRVSYNLMPIIDLSCVDFISGQPMARETANCYVVRREGYYRFPLVYGNAITGGKEAPESYTTLGTQSDDLFVDAFGNSITSPYIIPESPSTRVSAELLWCDDMLDQIGIEDIEIIDNDIFFRCTRMEINAVIALKFDDVIVWSWHIWCTEKGFATEEVDGMEILNRNLGETVDEVSLLYQWGRKDPFSTALFNRKIGNDYVIGTFSPSRCRYSDLIQCPHLFTCKEYMPNAYFCAWNSNAGGDAVKTIYDPCPAGFRVADKGLFGNRDGMMLITETPEGFYYRRNPGDNDGIFIPKTKKIVSRQGTGSAYIVEADSYSIWYNEDSATRGTQNRLGAEVFFSGTVTSFSSLTALTIRPIK